MTTQELLDKALTRGDVIELVALVKGRVLHAGTNEPPLGTVRVTTAEGSVVSKGLPDGTFVVSGYVEQLFPELDSASYDLNLHIQCESPQFWAGPRSIHRSVSIPAGLTVEEFPLDIGTLQLDPDPVIIRGRVYDATSGKDVFQLGASIYFARGANSAVKFVWPEVSTTEPIRTLNAAASAGQQIIQLDNLADLAIGQVLRIGAGATVEYGVIALPSTTSPGEVRLHNSLALRHGVGQPVQVVTFDSLPETAKLGRGSQVGDRFVVLTELSIDLSFDPACLLQIGSDIETEREYHILHRLRYVPIVGADIEVSSGGRTYSATTDKLGRFSISHLNLSGQEEGEVFWADARILITVGSDKKQERRLGIDFSRPVHEETFKLLP